MSAALTDERTAALSDVEDELVVFFTIESQEPGFSWGQGQMPLEEVHALEDLWRCGLIKTLPPANVGERIDHRRRVRLTQSGREARP